MLGWNKKWETKNGLQGISERRERKRERECVCVCVCVCERESGRGGGTSRKRGLLALYIGKKKTLLEAMFASLANFNSADNGELYTRLSLSLSFFLFFAISPFLLIFISHSQTNVSFLSLFFFHMVSLSFFISYTITQFLSILLSHILMFPSFLSLSVFHLGSLSLSLSLHFIISFCLSLLASLCAFAKRAKLWGSLFLPMGEYFS